ncbi:translation initiation factor IF-2-like [Catharus ustulatus]|uniref:translation initiation factor IF-2-like n=1 Tax=Catharus ustulatus TaxID=91951 RepID=UPI001409A3D9|nr:translation initiation factor IF-2-like [Catharus ustulatus]
MSPMSLCVPSAAAAAHRPRALGPRAGPDVSRLGLHPPRGHPEVAPQRGSRRGHSGTIAGAAGRGRNIPDAGDDRGGTGDKGHLGVLGAAPQPAGARQRHVGPGIVPKPVPRGGPGGAGPAAGAAPLHLRPLPLPGLRFHLQCHPRRLLPPPR